MLGIVAQKVLSLLRMLLRIAQALAQRTTRGPPGSREKLLWNSIRCRQLNPRLQGGAQLQH